MNVAAMGAGACCILAGPALATRFGGKSVGFCRRIEGLRGVSQRIECLIGSRSKRLWRVYAGEDDEDGEWDFDESEVPSVQKRSDGRLFMESDGLEWNLVEDEELMPEGKQKSPPLKKSRGQRDGEESPAVRSRRNRSKYIEEEEEEEEEEGEERVFRKKKRTHRSSSRAENRHDEETEVARKRRGKQKFNSRSEDSEAEEAVGKEERTRRGRKETSGIDWKSKITKGEGEESTSVAGQNRMKDEFEKFEDMTKELGANQRIESRRKILIREQVFLPAMGLKDPRIAILGGGMSGLVCALTLEERGIQSTVFDTGKHGLGGRMATRDIVRFGTENFRFDHAAQYFTVKDPNFQKLVDQWVSDGAVKEWDGLVGTLREGEFTELPHSVKYVATHGMRYLAEHMVSKARLITVKRPCWITEMEPYEAYWVLSEKHRPEGAFDAVVIAHNGKCANQLLQPSGARLVAKQMKRLELSSIYALMAAFDKPLPQPANMKDGLILDGAFVEGINSLSWMCNNSRKLCLDPEVYPHCWTFLSTAHYGMKHKAPQESLSKAKVERVTDDVLRGVEIALGIPEGSLRLPSFSRVQLWGAALPINSLGTPCIFDAYSRVGVCGDWLLGASLEAAALSGMALANHIADFYAHLRTGGTEKDVYCLGLDGAPGDLEGGHDIGQFPGSTTPEKQNLTGRQVVPTFRKKPMSPRSTLIS